MSIEFPVWPCPPSVRALTTTRLSGTSLAPYDSFNTASHVGDISEHVEKNRAEVLKVTGSPIQWLNQVHGTEVVVLDKVEDRIPTADAAITSNAGVVCAVQTADCLPILLCDDKGEQVAAVHAGWRGLAAGIITATVTKFCASADHLSAWLGPAISQQHFEVGEEVYQNFEQWAQTTGIALKALQGPFRRVNDRFLADLYALARLELQQLGVSRLAEEQACTWRDAERYYSYRREGKTGRMTTAIWIVG